MRVLIVEDEATIAALLRRMIMQLDGENNPVIDVVTSFDQASAYFSENEIDLLLLDLNLNGQNGFQLLHQAVACSFQTIIISAYREKAIEAFEFGVLDFISKPFTYQRLQKGIERFKQKTGTGRTARCLTIKRNGNIELVETNRIKYIRAYGDYSYLILADNSKLLHDKSLESLETILQPVFFRIHKSYMVKLEAVKIIHVGAGSKYEAELVTGELLPVGRTRYTALKKVLLGTN